MLCHFLVLLQIIKTISELCQPSVNDGIVNKKLYGYVLVSYDHVPTGKDCDEACSFHGHCHSVNFCHENKTCELNRANDVSSPGSLRDAAGWLHINYVGRPPTQCGENAVLGMEDGRIKDEQLSQSTAYANKIKGYRARLNSDLGGWAVGALNKHQWIQVKFDVPHTIVAIATQGKSNKWQFVKSYIVKYSDDGKTFTSYNNSQIFTGNTNNRGVVRNEMHFKAKYVRICPQTWWGWIALRFELYGCSL